MTLRNDGPPGARRRENRGTKSVPPRVAGLLALFFLLLAATARADCPVVRVATVPLLSGGRPLVEASINGHPVAMVIDTGAQESSVTPQTAARLKLPRDPAQPTVVIHTIAGEERSANVQLAALSLARLSFKNLNATVVAIPALANGLAPAGVIGADALSQYDLDLDIPRRSLTFYQTAGCTPISPPWQGAYQIVPARVQDRRFLIPVKLNGHPVAAEFDTGSRGETVSRAAANRIGITDAELDGDPASTTVSAGMRRYTAHRHRFQTFEVGRETFRNLAFQVASFGQLGIDMLIGADYMHGRRFFISYASATLFIQKEPGKPPPPVPRSGVWAGRLDRPCGPTPAIRRMLAPLPAVAVTHPPIEPPEQARADHISGCAAAMFHLGLDGTPSDIKAVKVHPTGYGLRGWVVQQLAKIRFRPVLPGPEWYYEVIRFHAQ